MLWRKPLSQRINYSMCLQQWSSKSFYLMKAPWILSNIIHMIIEILEQHFLILKPGLLFLFPLFLFILSSKFEALGFNKSTTKTRTTFLIGNFVRLWKSFLFNQIIHMNYLPSKLLLAYPFKGVISKFWNFLYYWSDLT